MAKAQAQDVTARISIKPIEEVTEKFWVVGVAPLLQLKFSQKTMQKLKETHEAGSKAKNRKAKPARDFDADFHNSYHLSTEGWYGVPATAFKNALVSACRFADIPMTRAKLLFHVHPDGFDGESGDPLVKILDPNPKAKKQPEPEKHIGHVRNASGVVDLRVRALWRSWAACVRVTYDYSCMGPQDVLALIYRAGKQVGIGEGRPDSRNSCGMGFGLFEAHLLGNESKEAA